MKRGIGIVVAGIVLAGIASWGTTEIPASDPETIASLEQVTGLAKAAQEQFWQLVPPMDDPLYIHPERIVRAVDWKSKEWPNALKKQMVAQMEAVNSSMYPFYRMSVVETRTGELVYYNAFDQQIWWTPAPADYNPYLFAFQLYAVDSIEELTTQQLELGRSSNIGFEILLLPEVFMDSYKEDAAMELAAQQELLAAQEAALASSEESETVSVGISLVSAAGSLAESEGLDGGMAMMSSPPPPPGGGGGTNGTSGSSTSNLLVELAITIPAGFGHMGHIETFTKDDLVYSPSWTSADDWIPTYGAEAVKWTDPASSNKMQRFYLVSNAADTDGDGHSDLYEAWVGGTDSNTFNSVNVDGDDLHDWLELKIFGDLSQTGADDFDSDGLLNNEELVVSGQTATMLSNPALADSDAEGLDDYQERRVLGTDAMDPDTDSDGRDDAAEVQGSPATDPHNPDTVVPVVAFLGD